MLVGQVGVADNHRVGDVDTLLAHLDGLLELAVLERYLHRLLGDHHVILAHGHVIEVGVRLRFELVYLQHFLLRLARHGVRLGDAKDPVAVVVALNQLQDAIGQELARVRQIVQRHGQLLLAGELFCLDGDARYLGALLPAHGLGHGHILEGLRCAVDELVHARGDLVRLDLFWLR